MGTIEQRGLGQVKLAKRFADACEAKKVLGGHRTSDMSRMGTHCPKTANGHHICAHLQFFI